METERRARKSYKQKQRVRQGQREVHIDTHTPRTRETHAERRAHTERDEETHI